MNLKKKKSIRLLATWHKNLCNGVPISIHSFVNWNQTLLCTFEGQKLGHNHSSKIQNERCHASVSSVFDGENVAIAATDYMATTVACINFSTDMSIDRSILKLF